MIDGAVGIGALHRLDHQMQASRAAAELGEIVAFQDVEHLDQLHAAG